jgi:hypothetical protein
MISIAVKPQGLFHLMELIKLEREILRVNDFLLHVALL